MDFVQHASEYTLFSTGVGEAEGEGDCFASCSLFRYNLHRESRHSFRGFDILETLAISLFCLVRMGVRDLLEAQPTPALVRWQSWTTCSCARERNRRPALKSSTSRRQQTLGLCPVSPP